MKTCRKGLHQYTGPQCLDCKRTRKRAWYRANATKAKASVGAWIKANPEKYRALRRKSYARRATEINARVAEDVKANPTKYRERRLRSTYGIGLEIFAQLLARQENRCRGCQRTQEEIKGPLVVDHDHGCCSGRRSCGKCIRGLLCDKCNRILGLAQDRPQTLLRLAGYLKNST